MEQIREKQFDLIYYGKFTWEATSQMTYSELNWYYSKLLATKKEEQEAHEKAAKEAEAARKQAKLAQQLRSINRRR